MINNARNLSSYSAACSNAGEARGPYLADSTLYVAASGQASGIEGYGDRLSALTSIVRVQGEDGAAEVIAAEFSRVWDVAISPDGTTLAVTGNRGTDDSCWLVDLASGAIRHVDISSADYVSFSPSGQQVATTANGSAVFADV